MKQSVTLTVASVLSVLFFSLHLADDIVRGFEEGGRPWNLFAGLLRHPFGARAVETAAGPAPDDGAVSRPDDRDRDPGPQGRLAIVSDLAELYGGSVTLETSPLGGTRALLQLPRL